MRKFRVTAILGSLVILAALPLTAEATNSWNGYHWARSSNPLTVKVIDSMTPDWDGNLAAAIGDWDASTALLVSRDTAGADDSMKARKRCPAVSGKVRACNAPYGYNGWLGLAQIWVSGGHIVQGTAKMNDSYLTSYTETNRQHVICQEIGHDWGLGHQDESGADLNTCMDYANALDNPKPNAHDYQQLETIYSSHTDSSTTAASLPAGFANADVHAQSTWGEKIEEAADGRAALFVRHFGDGLVLYTHVTWVR